MHRILLLTLACLLSTTSGTDTNYRLNTPIVPKAYTITITPYFDTNDANAFTFDGEVSIILTTTEETKQIKLHSQDLIFVADNVTVSDANGDLASASTDPLVFETYYSFAYINLETELQVGAEYTLTISYRGPIREDLVGFYRNYYIENGVKKWLGATQMETTHTRKAFPCLDEPGFKATFTLIVDRPQNYKPSLTNTKLQTTYSLSNGYVREVFYPTPIMPTYLVAFMVSEFDAALVNSTDGREFAVYTRPDAVNQTDYAFDFGMRVEKALSDYFGIDYYSVDENLKLDHVALPDFRSGAMENWGLIKYRETLLLYVPEESTPFYKKEVAQTVAHETVHMWFGNLVTCHWWSNTWLNEGFATYFQDYITALIEPEVSAAEQLVIGSVYSAYNADSSPSSAPITNNDVNSPAEVSGHFGTISYYKAGSIIRMMHHFIGDAAFKYGLHEYLDVNRYGSGYPELMYSALENGVKHSNSLVDYPGITITDVMSSWISQAGHPLLHVHVNYTDDTVTLTQKRFYSNSSYSSNEVYSIPITYTTGETIDFENTKPAFVMNEKSHQFVIANISKTHTWVIFNIQETGFYRVTYDEHTWEHLGLALRGEDRNKIHQFNRAKIVNDLFDLYYADEVSFSLLLETLEFLKNETENTVWFAAIKGFNKLRNSFLGDSALRDIENLALGFMENAIEELGYEVRETDDFLTLTNRQQLLEFACKIGHEGCIEKTLAEYKRFKEIEESISPSLRPVTYCTGLRFGDASDYDFLWNRMKTTNVANDARVIGGILGCSTDEGSLKKFLFSMQEENSPVKTQDLTVPLNSVLSNYSQLYVVIDSLKENYSVWSSIHSSMDTILSTVTSALHTEEDFTEFEAWLSSCTECTEQNKLSGKNALDSARAAAEWTNKHKEEILSALESRAIHSYSRHI